RVGAHVSRRGLLLALKRLIKRLVYHRVLWRFLVLYRRGASHDRYASCARQRVKLALQPAPISAHIHHAHPPERAGGLTAPHRLAAAARRERPALALAVDPDVQVTRAPRRLRGELSQRE